MINRIVAVLVLLWPLSGTADIRPFVADSLEDITAARAQQPFLLVLWSIDCPPCMQELQLLGQVRAQHSQLDVVLVAADDRAASPQAAQLLERFGLAEAENWIFADSYHDRLRYRIDSNWYGELPRAYFYAPDHTRRAYSGPLSLTQLTGWLRDPAGLSDATETPE